MLGAQIREHLFLKWEDQGKSPRTHDIFELNLETPSTMLAHRGAQYIFMKRKKGREGGREGRRKDGNLPSAKERKGRRSCVCRLLAK